MSLLAHYKLNGDANDASGNGHDGTPTAITWEAGKIGNCAHYNGSTSKIVVPNHADLQIVGDLTLCAWAFADSLSYHRVIFTKYFDGTHREYDLRVDGTTGYLRYTDSNVTRASTGSVGTGAWTHVAVVRSTAASRVYFYIDGIAAGDSAWASPPGTTTGTVGIGARASGWGKWVGELDDARIYNEALEQSKIQSIHDFGRGSEECEPWQRLIRRTIRPVIRPRLGGF